MKKIVLLILSLLGSAPILPLAPQGNAMLPMPSEEEMKEIQKFLDTLSPEELDELAKIGEEIIQTAEKEGRPLFGPAPTTQPVPKPVKSVATTHTVKETNQEKPKERVLSSKEKSRIQRILSGLVDVIASIRQKATSDETLLQLLAPLNTSLNDLTYYLNVVNYSKHLVHLTDTEFTPLNDNLRKLYEQLEELDSELYVPEVKVDKKQTSDEIKKQRQQVKKAAQLLQKFVSIIETTTKQKHVVTDLERLVKKYEPEALKIKQEQEEKEKKASTQKTNLPSTNILQTYRAPSGGGNRATQHYTNKPQGNRGGSYTNNSYGVSSSKPGSNASASSKTSASPTNKANPAAEAKKDKSSDKNKEALVKKTDNEKTQELEEKIQESISRVNERIAFHKPNLSSFFDSYLVSVEPVTEAVSTSINNVIDEASFSLRKIQKDIATWITKINAQATSAQEYKKNRDNLKKYIENNMKDTLDIHQQIKNAATTLNSGSARAQSHKNELKSFEKAIDDINKNFK